MKSATYWFAVLVSMFLAAPTVCTADPIYFYPFEFGGSGETGTVTSFNLKLYLTNTVDATSSPGIFNVVLSPPIQGQSFTIFSTDPGFAGFVNYFTNESVTALVVDNMDTTYGYNLGGWVYRTPYVVPGTGISNMTLTVNNFTLTYVTNANDSVLSYYCKLTLAMDAVPEPRTVLLIVVPGLLFLWRKRRLVF